MSKLSFRARALDAAKPMPIFMTEELPDLPDYSAINRAVPQMPSGMEKEEECEHHLQRAICTGLIIPTPEVSSIEDTESYDRLYATTYKMPRQLIHMQQFHHHHHWQLPQPLPRGAASSTNNRFWNLVFCFFSFIFIIFLAFAMEQDIPDYDMDSEDERFVNAQAKKSDLTPLKFEEMMDRLEKGSGQTVVTIQEAKSLLKEDDDLIIAVFDYWLNKRLKTVVPLIPVVKTEHRAGSAANNPYLAFRRRTEKMQTRKNRKNDETSYEKMLKLRRDLSRTVTLLELVKRREKTKREHLHLTIEIFEKRYQAQDFSGQLLSEVSAIKTPRPAFAPIFSNQFGLSQQHWLSKVPIKEEILLPRKEKRQYKRRKHKGSIGGVISRGSYLMSSLQASQDTMASSEEELESTRPEFIDLSQYDSEGMFSFKRKYGCSYLPPTSGFGNWPWCGEDENGGADKRFRYCPTNIATPRVRHIGLARKRLGRGGRVILDRASVLSDEFWSSVDYTVYDNKADLPLYQPKTPPELSETHWTNSDSENAVESLPNTLIIDVENLEGCGNFNSFHTLDDEQSGVMNGYCTGGKRGSADETLPVNSRSDEECDSVRNYNSGKSSEVIDRTRTVQNNEEENDKFNEEGCVSYLNHGTRNCIRYGGYSRGVGQRTYIDDRRTNNLSFNSISDLNRPGKHFFRRNYRIGGFKNINYRRKAKDNVEEKPFKFTTSEISLPDLFADSSEKLIPEAELESNDDSFALLDKLGLDDDFIKKGPEISLDIDNPVDKTDGLTKTETGQNISDSQSNSFQKQRLKIDKNIFEFSETDFLKYETDCDVDDLLPETVQNDVVGCCGLFGLTPNSRFNLVSPTYLPLEGEKIENDQLEEQIDITDDKIGGQSGKKSYTSSGSTSAYGQIADISNDVENHEVTLQLKMNRNVESGAAVNLLTSRLNVKNDFPDGFHVGGGGDDKEKVNPTPNPPSAPQNQSQQQQHQQPQQTINDIYALNHHNYTISGPPGYNFKQTSSENTQNPGKFESEVHCNIQNVAVTSSSESSSISGNTCSSFISGGQNVGTIWSGQIMRSNQQNLKTGRPPQQSTTLGFTKLSALSGARVTHNLGHTTINHDPAGTTILRDQTPSKVIINSTGAGLGDSSARNVKNEDIIKATNHDGPGILRTYRGNNARNIHLSSDGSLLVPDSTKKSVSNGPANIGFNQRRIIRASAITGQQQSSSISAQNPTVTQLVTTPSVFTIEGVSTNQNFVGASQNFVVNQGFVTSNQNTTFLGSNQAVNYVTTNQSLISSNQTKQLSLPQRKVSLLVNPAQTVVVREAMTDVDLGNESLETIDIETSERDDGEEQAASQEIPVDNKKQMSVRKNNSLPMEVT